MTMTTKRRDSGRDNDYDNQKEIAAVTTTKTTKERDSGSKDKLDDNQRERQQLGLE